MFNQSFKTNLLGLTIQELKTIAIQNDLKPFLAQQIYDWLYKKRVDNFKEMTNVSKKNIEFLQNNFYYETLKIKIKQIDPIDETTKFLFELNDGNLIETVLLVFDYGYSVCVTTQVGCNMGCKFCASGLLKKKRNLEVYEIVSQVYTVQKYLDKFKPGSRISNVIVMGIGEPFDNFDNLIKFITIINSDYGLQIGARKITVSTCGIVKKIPEWTKLMPQVGLAISLHAPNNEIRNSIMPVNKAYDINALIIAAKEYTKITHRRITFEYILLANINDTNECAIQLAKLLQNMLCYVNLIPYNPVNENSYQRSKNVINFANKLSSMGIQVTIRQEKGTNIDAACGQLRANNEKK